MAIINDEYTVLSPSSYANQNITEAVVKYINDTKALSNSSFYSLLS